MPGTKRNDSHRNNHQHHFFHNDKGKKTNLVVKPTKRQQDLHEKTFLGKNKFGFEPVEIEHPRRREEWQDATIEHLVALEKERFAASQSMSEFDKKWCYDWQTSILDTESQDSLNNEGSETETEESSSSLSM